MAVFNEPTKWAQTLGKDADVVTIPDIAGDTDPSIDKIFPSVFSIPLARGGKAIPRSVLNGLFKLLGDWCFYQQNGGIASYSNTFDYAVGSFVKYNNKFYKCKQPCGASSTVVTPDSIDPDYLGADYWALLLTAEDIANIYATANTLGVVKPDNNTITVDGDGTLTATAQMPGVATTTNVGVVKPDGRTITITADGVISAIGSGSSVTGEIKWFAFKTVPTGYLVCNGASVSRTTYANLFAVIGTTFGSGDGSTTFNIPDLRDRYIIGANTNALGTQIAEQLPNITGETERFHGYGGESTGAFSNGTYVGAKFGGTSLESGFVSAVFNAHKSNPIYTDNGHVYPLSLALLPCIKY